MGGCFGDAMTGVAFASAYMKAKRSRNSFENKTQSKVAPENAARDTSGQNVRSMSAEWPVREDVTAAEPHRRRTSVSLPESTYYNPAHAHDSADARRNGRGKARSCQVYPDNSPSKSWDLSMAPTHVPRDGDRFSPARTKGDGNLVSFMHVLFVCFWNALLMCLCLRVWVRALHVDLKSLYDIYIV
jgi:hypothetical protein